MVNRSIILKRICLIFFCFLTTLTIFVFFTEKWLIHTWGDLSADEIVYHLKTSLGGTDASMVKQALLYYGLPALIVSVFLLAAVRFLSKTKKLLPYVITGLLVLNLGCLFFIKHDLDKKIDFTNYIKNQLSGKNNTFIEDNYVDPTNVALQFPNQKRNLVYIYLESMEITYADSKNGGSFAQNVIPELTALAEENEDFSGSDSLLNGGISLPGSTWTIGAMFSQSTGVPLKIPLAGNKMSHRDSFFPKLQSIGKILQREGYQQELLIGSNAKFGGRDVFYKNHGDYQLNDYSYAKENGRIPEDYLVRWGYEDEKLFQFAKEDLTRLAAGRKPFNLTMLTVDTHFEDGYRCRLCKEEFGEQYADVMACSSRQVTDFVRWIQKQDFYKDTSIVICGDHPTMDKDFCINVPEDYQRRTYVCFINSASEPEKKDKNRVYSTFDMFPTTLAAMGVKIDGNRLGLGVNLFSEEKTLIEKYGLKKCISELNLPSTFMTWMSGITLTEKTLKYMAKKVRIEMNEGPDSTTRFIVKNVKNFLNSESIRELVLELKDKKSGRVSVHPTHLVYPYKNNPNYFLYYVDVDLKGKPLDDYDGNFYISIEGTEHFKIADFSRIE